MIADEIQSGLGRTGHTFACEHEGVVPDIYLLGKALGGGIVPVSAVVADRDVLGVLQPGPARLHVRRQPAGLRGRPRGRRDAARPASSRRGPRELGDAPARPAGRAARPRRSPRCAGRGLWAGVDIDPRSLTGREVCERLAARGVLAKDTHGTTIRLAPPLVISQDDLDWGSTGSRTRSWLSRGQSSVGRRRR